MLFVTGWHCFWVGMYIAFGDVDEFIIDKNIQVIIQ